MVVLGNRRAISVASSPPDRFLSSDRGGVKDGFVLPELVMTKLVNSVHIQCAREEPVPQTNEGIIEPSHFAKQTQHTTSHSSASSAQLPPDTNEAAIIDAHFLEREK